MATPVEINELMERIRLMSVAPDGAGGVASDGAARPVDPALPPPLAMPPAPEVTGGDDRARVGFDQACAEAASMLPRARRKTEVSRLVPKWLRSLWRNQGGFNGILLETLERLLKASRHLQHENLDLQARLERLETAAARQHDWTAAATAAQDRSREWMGAVESYLLEIGGSREEVELRLRLKSGKLNALEPVDPGRDEWLGELQEQVHAIDKRVGEANDGQAARIAALQAGLDEWMSELQEQVHAIDKRVGEANDGQAARIAALQAGLDSLRAVAGELGAKAETLHHETDRGIHALRDEVGDVGRHADRLGDHLKNLQAQADDLLRRGDDRHAEFRLDAARHDLLQQNARRLEERQHNDASFVKNQLWFLERLIQPLLGQTQPATAAEAAGPEVRPGPAHTGAGGGHELDALYLAFEDVMRGSRDDVKQRVSVYLPYIRAANAGTAERPVLDLGSGRGEWLELLGEHHLAASGVDLNTAMIELCRERNLPVTMADVTGHLRALPDASCGAVTAFHLIEHLPFPALVLFLRECRRVLQPGGVAIFETPNPYNVLVGSGYFYHDFTHQRPLPPPSTKFLVEQLGFAEVEVLLLHPWDEASKVHGDGSKALEWRFNELFYGPQDYALIARV